MFTNLRWHTPKSCQTQVFAATTTTFTNFKLDGNSVQNILSGVKSLKVNHMLDKRSHVKCEFIHTNIKYVFETLARIHASSISWLTNLPTHFANYCSKFVTLGYLVNALHIINGYVKQ